MSGYTIRLHPAEDIGGYWVSCDEVPGALTQGVDVVEALMMMADAMSLMLEIEPKRAQREGLEVMARISEELGLYDVGEGV